jgi:acyl dehydratase
MNAKEKQMKYFNDFEVGEKIITKGRSINESDIVLFAAFSGDWNPLHTDIEFAKKGPFGERIAHGFLVLVVASGLMPIEGMAVLAFYGMDKVRFLGSTKIGDTIHVEMEVLEKQEKEKSGVVSFKTSIKNQKEEDVAVLILKVALHKK